ncbi:MAG: prolyl oligopeptidase family serine peptidase [Paraglaciecola sp.]|uniref:alpha/beta hydrolase family protein n=1 Tax=Paraglaciecola sp. TaxID=1920173 RepID=UPI00326303F2
MLKILIFLLLINMCINDSSYAEIHFTHPDIVATQSCYRGQFESYESWMQMLKKMNQRKAKTPEALEKRMSRLQTLFSKSSFDNYKVSLECITFKYKVDGVFVDGYLIKPKNQENLPVLIYNRGGNGRYGAVVFGAMLNNLFPVAEQGFAIIGSQYRGAFDDDVKPGEYDEFGGADVDDVVKLMDFIPNIENVDVSRIGMYGSSRGGMQTFLALQHMPNVKAVASVMGASDLLKELENRAEMENVYKIRIPNYDTNKAAELEKRSVLKWADKLNKSVPILLQHGDKDKKVNVANAIWLDKVLTKLAHPHKLSIYKGEGHGWSSETKPLVIKELTDWFHEYL